LHHKTARTTLFAQSKSDALDRPASGDVVEQPPAPVPQVTGRICHDLLQVLDLRLILCLLPIATLGQTAPTAQN